MAKVGVLVFVGEGGSSEVERMVAEGQQAATLDTVERVLATGLCDPVIVCTDSLALSEQLRTWPVIVELHREPFHFGRRLRALIEKHRVEFPFYLGGGSAPLFSQAELAQVCQTLLHLERGVISNNFYSADFAAFAPGQAIASVPLPAIDNDLAFLLASQAGLPSLSLPRSASTQMDVDTPIDLAVLVFHPALGPHLRRYLSGLSLNLPQITKVMACLTDQDSEVVFAGRVSSHVWSYLEKEAACRKRVFSEERGMRASGREERAKVVSLLGMYLQSVGPWAFFRSLGSLGHAAVIDTRVIFQHLGLRLSAPDRFNSDLLRVDAIADPYLKEFTAAALEAPIPVLLGGHSVVAGGLLALIEAAWAHCDQPRGAIPPSATAAGADASGA